MQRFVPEGYQFNDHFRVDATDAYWPAASLNFFEASKDYGELVGSFRVLPMPEETLAAGLWVSSEHRRKGIGTQLVRNVIGRYGNHDIRLKVNPFEDKPVTLHALIRFYAGLGFLIDKSYKAAPVVMVRRAW
jgi:GNAT superfamily N-acetyltransferase